MKKVLWVVSARKSNVVWKNYVSRDSLVSMDRISSKEGFDEISFVLAGNSEKIIDLFGELLKVPEIGLTVGRLKLL